MEDAAGRGKFGRESGRASALTDADLERECPEAVGGVTMRTSLFLMHLCSHAAFHLGQADYLRRTVNADARPAGTLPITPLGH